MRLPPPLPPEFRAEAFSVADAARAGVPAARLRRADLLAPHRGIRVAVEPRTGVERAFAYVPNLREGQAFSHVSAALLWGMWLPKRLQSDTFVDVLALAPRDRPVAARVRGHRGMNEPLAFARGLPVTSAPRTWVHLAPLLSLDELVAAGDSLIVARARWRRWMNSRAQSDRESVAQCWLVEPLPSCVQGRIQRRRRKCGCCSVARGSPNPRSTGRS